MVIPLSWFTVDEAMVPFAKRFNHIVKMNNKPVSEGFKIWALGYDGYIEDWRFHSLIKGPEGTKRSGLRVN
jgi:hypothetical protein